SPFLHPHFSSTPTAPTELHTLALHDALPICTARQKRTDPHGHASRSELSVSAHLPSPSHTRSVKGNSSRSFSLALRSSQIFSTDGYSRESFHDRWSQCASTPRRPSFRSAKSTTMPPLTCPW